MQIIENQKKRKICDFYETHINGFFLLKINFVEKILLEKEKSKRRKRKKKNWLKIKTEKTETIWVLNSPRKRVFCDI